MKTVLFLFLALGIGTFPTIGESVVTTHKFSAEVDNIFKIVAGSLYKDPYSFIRELISNSHDAIVARISSGSGYGHDETEKGPRVEIWADKEKKTLTFNDTGIGMNAEDLVKNLGTIARSGTAELMKMKMEDSEKFIGQFGVGFYSALVPASRIDVITAKANEPKFIWSHIVGENSYSIREANIEDDDDWNPVVIGTKIILHLRDDPDILKLLDESELEDVINRTSAFIPVKLYLRVQKVIPKEKKIVDEEKKEKTEDEQEKEMVVDEQPEYTYEFKLVSKVPLWQRMPSEVSEDEYNSFYKSISNDHDAPITHVHFNLDSNLHSYSGILFIPKRSKFQPFGTDPTGEPISLYVRNVFVMNSFSNLIKRPFLVAPGIINSNDVSLNVSRETLQQEGVLKDVAKIVTSKVIDMFKGLTAFDEKYRSAYDEYSGHIKLAIIMEKEKKIKEKLGDLLMFHVTPGPQTPIFLKDYLLMMKEGQKAIYFASGTSIQEMMDLPYVSSLTKRQYPVLLLKNQFDEPVIQSLGSYDQKEIVNVSKGGLKIEEETEETKKKMVDEEKMFEPLIKYLVEVLEKTIEKVNLSHLLDNVPMAIVPSEYGWSPAMTKAMKDSANNPIAQFFQSRKRTLEINPKNDIILAFLRRVSVGEKSKDLEDDIKTLYDAQCLISGYDVDNPKSLSERIASSLNSKYCNGSEAAEEKPVMDL